MRRFGKILTCSAFIAAFALVSSTAQAPDDLDRGLADVAGRMSDAEYKKLELEYMNADVRTHCLFVREKATLDE